MHDSLECDEWQKFMVEKYALTLGDVRAMEPRESLEVLALDRNIWDTVMQDGTKNRDHRPQTFFDQARANYVHDRECQGRFRWTQDGFEYQDFEFQIEFKHGSWYPLTEGRLRALFPSDAPLIDPYVCHVSDLPDSTKVGWRGPMIPWDKLADAPCVYWDQ